MMSLPSSRERASHLPEGRSSLAGCEHTHTDSLVRRSETFHPHVAVPASTSHTILRSTWVWWGRNRCPDDRMARSKDCLLYTSDAADERSSVDLGGRRIIKKK